jgi:mono/diheme cytochrome c family protein
MNTLDQNSKAAAIIMVAVLLFGHPCRSTAVADESAAALQILRTKCGSCHNAKNPKAGLNLTSLAGVLAGGESGLAIDKDAANSLLWKMVDSEAMPPEDSPQLTDAEKQTFWKWLKSDEVTRRIQPQRVSDAQVLPILELRCTVCHGKRLQEGGLDLRSLESMLTGGNSGPALVPGKPADSLLLKKIHAGEMPPKRRIVEVSIQVITASEISRLEQWTAQGAMVDRDKADPENSADDGLVTNEDRQFWSFGEVKRPAVPVAVVAATDPVTTNNVTLHNPIDAYIHQQLKKHNLDFSQRASRSTLIRRLYLDLLGVPPSPPQILEFVNDASPIAYERLVDEVLASPAYGERWGGLWLDLAGYADSEGIQESDPPRPWNYLYRDYVIKSFNQDKPYSDFITQQLAGDELGDYSDADQITAEVFDNLVATGFLRQSSDGTFSNITGFVPDRQRYINSVIEVYSSAILGLTIKCARCHSHKFDPIPQQDFYRLLDVFKGALDENHWYAPLERGTGRHKPARYLPLMKTSDRLALEANNETWQGEIDVLQRALTSREEMEISKIVAARLSEVPQSIRMDVENMLGIAKEQRNKIQTYLAERFEEYLTVTIEDAELQDKAFAEYRTNQTKAILALKEKLQTPTKIRALWDDGDPSATYILTRGNYLTPARRVDAGVPSVLTDGKTEFVVNPLTAARPGGDDGNRIVSTGRRLALARWTVQREHPLTARVMVNRIWKHHFAKGLVSTLENFGLAGARPSHPQLLDWLSAEFMENGWSVKRIHYLIATSRTYQQSSGINDQHLVQDPANTWLARMPMRRLDAEMLRDSLLAIANVLSLQPFGPADGVTPRADGLVVSNDTQGGWRRSIYVLHRRTTMPTLLVNFDRPRMSPNCIERTESTVAPQALHLMNDKQIHHWTELFAERVKANAGNDSAQRITYAYLCATGREPSDSEMQVASLFLEKLTKQWQSEQVADAADKALVNLCHALINSAAFLYVD